VSFGFLAGFNGLTVTFLWKFSPFLAWKLCSVGLPPVPVPKLAGEIDVDAVGCYRQLAANSD